MFPQLDWCRARWSHDSKIELPVRHERNLSYEHTPDWMKAGRYSAMNVCCAEDRLCSSALRAATSCVVVRSTAVTAITLTEVHRGNPLEMIEHIATSHSW